jgi:hypothetical protein
MGFGLFFLENSKLGDPILQFKKKSIIQNKKINLKQFFLTTLDLQIK